MSIHRIELEIPKDKSYEQERIANLVYLNFPIASLHTTYIDSGNFRVIAYGDSEREEQRAEDYLEARWE